jgi:hypothetical protein
LFIDTGCAADVLRGDATVDDVLLPPDLRTGGAIELDDEWSRLDHEERTAPEIAASATYEAMAAGRKAPAVKPVDNAAAKATIEAKIEALLRLAAEAQNAYIVAVRSELPAWRDVIAKSLIAKREEARRHLSDLGAAVNGWLAVKNALAVMNLEIDPGWYPPGRDILGRVPDTIAALADLSKGLGASNDAISGDYLAAPLGLDPPMWHRQWIATYGGQSDVRALANIEAEEQFKHTSLTRDPKSP